MDLRKFSNDLRLAVATDLEVKATAEGRIEGYASTFGGGPDRHGDVVSVGAFTKTLAEHRAAGTSPVMLWSHRLEEPIGSWSHIEEDSTGLFVAGQVNLKTTKGRDAFEHISAGDAGAFSIGFLTPEGGRRYLGKGVFALDQIDLVEVSIVTVPANTRARIRAVKHLESKAATVQFLREAGLPKAAATKLAAGGFAALAGTALDQERVKKFAEMIEAKTPQMKG
ncbi:HK97 family phage prohead protease [Roseovarius sp. MBR-6]|uniref:HK97 family phage prohead protease n=1 Tax=Roseovarius sp. MBR-6 TaxID=3156459 RepID=UPI003393C714